MTIERRGSRIDVGGTTVEVVHRDIKNLHVGCILQVAGYG